jgi:hypothetical protein
VKWLVEFEAESGAPRSSGHKEYVSGELHPRIEASGALAFYDERPRQGGGAARPVPSPLLAFSGWWRLSQTTGEAV